MAAIKDGRNRDSPAGPPALSSERGFEEAAIMCGCLAGLARQQPRCERER